MNILLSAVTALLLSFVYTASYSFSEASLYSAGAIAIGSIGLLSFWKLESGVAKKVAVALISFSATLGVLSLVVFSLPTVEPAYFMAGVILLSVASAKAALYAIEDLSALKKPTQHAAPQPVKPVQSKGVEGFVKILDTSIVIDGRIIDIAGTGFLEGPFVIPNFVLREVQLISDSQDPIKRNRGRRGLEMLNELQKREDLEVKIEYKDYTDTREVDAKLVKLAMDLGGKLITNDYNLNKVAELQGIEVLNMNNLANSLKPLVLPGEEMEFQIVKEGKDDNQGVGYLEDGTMVIVENGGKLIGKKVKVAVTSVLQTNAGKLIFTKPLNQGNNNNSRNNHRNERREKQDKVAQNS